ncbi:MAG: hypothetical protein IT258_16215 [Saprospiraceae bacterium]|nr:hypothetical protein [Saprospiraceae bacterium]
MDGLLRNDKGDAHTKRGQYRQSERQKNGDGINPPTTVNRPPSTDHRQPSTDHRQPTTVNRPPSTVNRQPFK